MRFDFLNDNANDILEICEKARIKKEKYIKSLGKKITKKEDEELTEKFVNEELQTYIKQRQEQEKPKTKNKMDYPDINEDYESDSLEFDELQDMLDDDDYDDM